MILSVSRRTDIPNHYADWFLNRIRAGELYVKNPVNAKQIRRVDLSPEAVDCIVFWTKNPSGIIDRLDELHDYHYYFQFTLTGYGRDIEPGLPDKKKVLIPLFRKLADRIGKERVVWRYDPILINDRYTAEYHEKAFSQIAESLSGYTERVVVSFLDMYTGIQKDMERFGVGEAPEGEIRNLAGRLAAIAGDHGLEIVSCAEAMDLEAEGIRHGSCIDRELIERITGKSLPVKKDRNQRPACGCAESVDVGAYDTCPNGCRYCYAVRSAARVRANRERYDAEGEMLCGELQK